MRKMDRRILVLLAVGYCLAYVDRVNISFAAVQLTRDLHFTASVYGAGAGLFFISYALCEIPANLVLVSLGARRWLSLIMIAWGVVSIATIFVRTPHEFYAARLALGISEAGFFPGTIYYLTRWYPASHRSSAVSRFYLAYPLSSSVMGAVAGYLMGLDGHVGLPGWQWLLLSEACPAILVGLLLFYLLPDSPASARWLSEGEKQALEQALAEKPISAGVPQPAARSVIFEPQVWLLGGALFLLYLGIYGYTFNAPALVEKSTHLGNIGVGWILGGFGVAGALCMWVNGRHADRSTAPLRHVNLPALVMAAGFLIAGVSESAWLVLPGLLLIFASYNALQGPFWCLPSLLLDRSSVAGGVAGINMIAIFGGFCGPYWMGVSKDLTGNYRLGLLTFAAPAVGSCLLLVAAMGRKQSAGVNNGV